MKRCVRSTIAASLLLACGPLAVCAEPPAQPPAGQKLPAPGKQAEAVRPIRPPAFDKDAYENGQGGILYGKGWAFLIAAPRGWVMDEGGAMMGGQVNAAFYRRGKSWTESSAVMYANVVPKIKGEDDTLEKVIRADVEQTKAHDSRMKAQPGPPLATADGRKAVVYTFAGPGTGRAAERVAYVDTPHFVIMLVLTARSEAAYTAAQADFATLVRSFGFFNGGVNVQHPRRAPATRRPSRR